MDIEFHYWVTGLVARMAGFREEEARTIAYASQFTDDNDRELEIEDRSTGETYRNYISQTLDITKPMERRLHIYPVFHFVPGDYEAESARRNDGKMHLLNTTPGSELAEELLKAAFQDPEETRLYRIGIASHAFADTWAHQNFVGFKDSFNGEFLDNSNFSIGHAIFMHNPDMVGHCWEDPRLVVSHVDNNQRFRTAACALLMLYSEYLKKTPEDTRSEISALDTILKNWWGVARKQSSHTYEMQHPGRVELYKKEIPWLPDYDEMTWLKDSVDIEVRGLPDSYKEGLRNFFTLLPDRYYWKGPKEETTWYRFQEAVKAHQRLALSLMKERYKKMGLDARYWSVS